MMKNAEQKFVLNSNCFSLINLYYQSVMKMRYLTGMLMMSSYEEEHSIFFQWKKKDFCRRNLFLDLKINIDRFEREKFAQRTILFQTHFLRSLDQVQTCAHLAAQAKHVFLPWFLLKYVCKKDKNVVFADCSQRHLNTLGIDQYIFKQFASKFLKLLFLQHISKLEKYNNFD